MLPILLAGALLLASPITCDVKHVLDGSASPQSVNYLAAESQNGEFWWMSPNSPLKAAYDYYKKCNEKGNCLPPVAPGAPAPQPFRPQESINLNLKNNPFLNGNVQGNANFNENAGGSIDISKNPFLSGVVTTGNGAAIPEEKDGFLGVQPQQPFGGDKKKPGFATTHPLEQKPQKPGFAVNHPLDQHIICRGAGFVCVDKELCIDGIVNKNGEGILQTRSDVQYCNKQREACCQLETFPHALNEVTAGKSSVPGSVAKFGAGSGFSAGTIQVLPQDAPSEIKPRISVTGENGHQSTSSSTAKSVRDVSSSGFQSTVDYSDVQFANDVRFGSTFQGPAYLPPLGSSPPPKYSTPDFSTPKPSISTYQPSVPPRTYVPVTTPVPTRSPSTPRPVVSTYQPSVPSRTYVPVTTPVPTRPTTNREYLPPRVTIPSSSNTINNQPYQPPTQRPYQPTTPRPVFSSTTLRPNPDGYNYPTPTPKFEYPDNQTPSSSNTVNNQYIPPPGPTKPPNSGSTIFTDAVPDSARNPETFQRPPQPPGGENTAPPTSCAAALKCVQEIYCTADGFVSPVPVVLTKEQELARVPTTVCQDQEAGIIGKCCRDPNYKDPWPSANLVNGVDDGQYKEDDSIGQYKQDLQRIVRSHTGGPRQDYSSFKNIDTPVAQEPLTCGERHLNTNPPGPGPLDVNFAEIPWQAMVLRDSNRSLLCGGAIIRRDAVLTTAHCVEGLETSDILIKGGEWKLGIDEEPLPFQIVKVVAIVRHPQYVRGSLVNDLAILVLEEKLRPAKNIGTICLPPPNQIPTENCIVTGWGKRILQLHAKGAIMHSINVGIMDNKQCQETLASRFQEALPNYSPNTLCGFSEKDQCKVDYGSALACSSGNNQYTLSGIFAWDTGCKQEGQVGGYIAPDVEWIESSLAKPLKELKRLDREYRSQ